MPLEMKPTKNHRKKRPFQIAISILKTSIHTWRLFFFFSVFSSFSFFGRISQLNQKERKREIWFHLVNSCFNCYQLHFRDVIMLSGLFEDCLWNKIFNFIQKRGGNRVGRVLFYFLITFRKDQAFSICNWIPKIPVVLFFKIRLFVIKRIVYFLGKCRKALIWW